jgi:predicted nucleic acid-binding protein
LIVVDASVTLSWCFPDEQAPLSLTVLDRLKAGETAIVPVFWSLEILNSLLVAEKRGRISVAQTQSFLGDLQALGPIFDYPSAAEVYGSIQKICREHLLTPYDALYIELALRRKSPLATLDEPQLKAAKALNIECL